MHIVFRVDSSYLMGTGHVMRCLALAEILQAKHAKVTWICRDLPGNCIEIIKRQGFCVLELPEHPEQKQVIHTFSEHRQWLGVPWQLDAEETIACLTSIEKSDWFIIDHYALGVDWEQEIRPYVTRMAVIDDLADREHYCELLIDQNYYNQPICRYKNKVPKECPVYIGPQYALLRQEFRAARLALIPRSGKVKRLLVFLGGSDLHNATILILSVLNGAIFSDIIVDVVVGASNPERNIIKDYCEAKNYNYHCQVTNMAELMAQADLAIGAGGITTWERCCVGLPSLVVSIAVNQEILVHFAEPACIFEYVGSAATLNKLRLSNQLEELVINQNKLQKMSENGLALVDGLGAERVANLLLAGVDND